MFVQVYTFNMLSFCVQAVFLVADVHLNYVLM